MNGEVLRILKMVQESKISADEAASLIEALPAGNPEAIAPGTDSTGKKPTSLWILVTKGDAKVVKIKVPVSLAACVVKYLPKGMTERIKVGEETIDLSAMVDMIDKMPCGEIMTVETNKGETVRICCE